MIYLKLFWEFLKIGAFTFGGGYAMLPLIQDAVYANNWIDAKTLIDFVAVSESTPGPFAVNIATYVGATVGGDSGVLGSLLGAFCSTLGVALPSFVIILVIAKCFDKFSNSAFVKGCMSGLKPAVPGLIAAAALSIAITVFLPNGFSTEMFSSISLYVSLFIFALCAVLAFKKAHPILIVCISAALGIISGYALP